MEENFTTHWCPFCGGVSHPATGCVYSPTFIACWRCTVDAARWVQNFTNSKGRRNGRIAFYDHVNVISPPITIGATVAAPEV